MTTYFRNTPIPGTEGKIDSFIVCGVGDCEYPLEAEMGHWDDGHEHDGKTGIHGHCPEHGARFVKID